MQHDNAAQPCIRLDQFATLWGQQRGQSIALIDPANHGELGFGPPKDLNFRQVDMAATALALFFQKQGLKPGEIVALQLPNTALLPLIILGLMRANCVPCLLPYLWGQSEWLQAFKKVKPSALISAPHSEGGLLKSDLQGKKFQTLKKYIPLIFSLYENGARAGNGTGNDARNEEHSPPRVDIPLDAIIDQALDDAKNSDTVTIDASLAPPLAEKDAQQIPALISWTVREESGLTPLYHRHEDLISSGLYHVLETGINSTDRMVNLFPITHMTGLSTAFIPWLLTGACLIQHQPFDLDCYFADLALHKANYAVLPASMFHTIQESRFLNSEHCALQKMSCVWNAPHDLRSFAKRDNAAQISPQTAPQVAPRIPAQIPVYDLYNLADLVVLTSAAREGEHPRPIPLGKMSAPQGAQSLALALSDDVLIETRLKGSIKAGQNDEAALTGRINIRSKIVPAMTWPAASKAPQGEAASENWIDTGIDARIEGQDTPVLSCITHPDMIYHGGLTIEAKELDRLFSAYPDFSDAAAFTIDDPLLGDRIYAAIVPAPGAAPSYRAFKSYLNAVKVAEYKTPEKIVIVPSIPRDQDGAILRDQLLSGL